MDAAHEPAARWEKEADHRRAPGSWRGWPVPVRAADRLRSWRPGLGQRCSARWDCGGRLDGDGEGDDDEEEEAHRTTESEARQADGEDCRGQPSPAQQIALSQSTESGVRSRVSTTRLENSHASKRTRPCVWTETQ
jgi:hypothetical protein